MMFPTGERPCDLWTECFWDDYDQEWRKFLRQQRRRKGK